MKISRILLAIPHQAYCWVTWNAESGKSSCPGPLSRSRNKNVCFPPQPACSHLNSYKARAGRYDNQHFPRLNARCHYRPAS